MDWVVELDLGQGLWWWAFGWGVLLFGLWGVVAKGSVWLYEI